MTKRKRNIVALVLVACLTLSSGIPVSAKEVTGKLGDGTYVKLEVSTTQIWALTVASNSTTRVNAFRYPVGGSPNQLIAMGTVTGSDIVHVTPPSGWSIGKGNSWHSHGDFTATLTAFS